ncbi:MAG TPA: hypothetical protein VFN14_00945, partial [Candidatus Limnocylindria bacterium]|nr:hypothetical protein [Candidatus Limnocylindria bacterium]
PAMAAHAAGDRRAEFGVLLRRVLGICAALTAVTAVLLLLLGPFALRLLFGFHHGLGALVFLAMGVSVGLFLTAAVLAQALLGRGRHAATTLGWLVGLVGLGLGTIVSGSPVDRATVGFLCGALASALTFAVLLGAELRTWSAGRRSPARHRRMAEQPARAAADTPPSGAAGIVEGGDSLSLISTLGADTATGSASVAAPGAQLREPWWRPALRLVLALGVAAAIGILWWRHEPRSLSTPIDIIGYPTFVNYDYEPSFLAYRLVVWEFPVVTMVLYALLGWRGPLRRRAYGGVRRPIALRTAEDQDRPTLPVGRLVSICARLALPVIVIAIETDTRARAPRVDLHGVKYGLAYGAAIVCGAALAVVVLGLRADRSDRWWALRAWGRWIGLLNGLLAGAACLVGLWLMTRSTSVYVRDDQTYHYYPWLPWWGGVSLAAVAAGWALWRLVRRRDPARIEALTLKVVVGSVFVFLATSAVPQALTYFQGYDDSQWLAGARALKAGGFPWRDFYVIHGLFYDVFQGNISLALFGNSIWGAQAGIAVVIVPLAWVGLYLFAVWVCRRNAWLLIFGAVLLVSGLPSPIEQRFILVPLALVLFGETVARRSARWSVALAVTMFVLELIVPETLYVSIPILLALAAADFLHRDRERPLRAAFRRTYWVLGVGAVLCAIWAIFLAINHALHAFIEYYVIFGPGHDASGAIPPVAITTKLWVQFALGIALVLITYLAVAVRLRNRTDWTPRQWVAVAAAGFAALYGEKALGRFDTSHIDQTFTAALPLLILQ